MASQWIPALVVGSALFTVCGAAEMERCRPVDTGAELRNPGMGWVLHYYDNVPANYGSRLAPADALAEWPGLGASYLRIPWAWIEPAEGEYRWSVLDTPLQRYAATGLPAGLRITCSESWTEYGTPEWVRLAGARGYRFRSGQGMVENGPFWEPDYDDPVFMAKLEVLVAALARRYDGNPAVAFVDVGSFGVWGEGHTWSSTRKAYPNTTVMRHVEVWVRHFRRTPVLGMDDFLSRPGTEPRLVPGRQRASFDLVLPLAWRGREFLLRAGVWQRGFAGPQSRRRPLDDDGEATTLVARLRIGEDGIPVAEALDRACPETLPEGTDVALRWLGLRHDPVQQPYSLKLDLEVAVAPGVPPEAGVFLHLLDPETRQQVFVPRSEREDDELTAWMAAQGIGMRDDSILVQGEGAAYFHALMAQQFWPHQPVYIESEHYGSSHSRGCWGDGSGFLQAIEDNHASYASIHWWPHEFLAANRELVRRINQRLGYRFVPAEVAWTRSARIGGSVRVEWAWRNAGVAPSYQSLYPALTLKDREEGIAGVFVDETLDLRELVVQARGETPARTSALEQALPFQMKAGRYGVFVSVGDRIGTPVVALPVAGDDGQRRYRVGTLVVEGDYAVALESARFEGAQLHVELAWQSHRALPATAIPFLHLERDGKLAQAGGPAPETDFAALRRGGMQKTTHALELPEPAGGPLRLLVGLWQPDRIGKNDERLLPDEGSGDNRVLLGTLARTAAGWEFQSRQAEP
ncbi:MAG: DUF4832 domain-containing protein [Lentisphaeria bacterium]|jgi:hypothetical protein|nr:DUF4832 domain-containing protein [Lentisphaeria bacterium]